MNLQFDAYIFDLGGVILNIDYKKTIKAFKKLGVKNIDKIYSQAQQNHIFDDFETGKISAQEFREYIKSQSSIELNDTQIDDAWNAMLLDLPKDRIELLLQLRKGHKIFLYSNTNAIHLKAFKHIIKQQYGDENLLETIFNQTYYSHLIGKRKPHPEGFLQIINDHNLNPKTTFFIDDTYQHVKGAKKVGLKTFWLKKRDVFLLFCVFFS